MLVSVIRRRGYGVRNVLKKINSAKMKGGNTWNMASKEWHDETQQGDGSIYGSNAWLFDLYCRQPCKRTTKMVERRWRKVYGSIGPGSLIIEKVVAERIKGINAHGYQFQSPDRRRLQDPQNSSMDTQCCTEQLQSVECRKCLFVARNRDRRDPAPC